MTVTVHAVGNAHLDPVWLWRWQEGFQEAKATFRSALDRMNEYDDFTFTSSQAAVYEWIEQHDPELFAEIRERVKEGRWVLCGGWWVQSDCNLPDGESFVRQGLYGQRYFMDKFGAYAVTGYNVDSFGHHAMLPQLLQKCGLTNYVFMRPMDYEKKLDSPLFWWESPDGTRVLTYRIPFYTHVGHGEELERALADYESRPDFIAGPDEMMFYGVGNHGGGPTKRNIETLRQYMQESDPNGRRIVFSSPDRFFANVLASGRRTGVVREELQMHAKGCYSAHSGVKRWNRKAEQLLLTAETFAAIAQRMTGQPYPKQMEQAWKNVLFNQFHDILPGSGIEPVYDDARDTYGEANAIAERALANALQSISWKVNIPFEEGMKPIVVFNPHTWPVTTNVELEFGHFGAGREYHSFRPTDRLVDEEGRKLAIQQVKSLCGHPWRQRLSFTASLPPLGYRTFRVVEGSATNSGAAFPPLAATDTTIENEFLKLQIDPSTGWIASLYDKRHDIEVFRAPAAVPAVLDDYSDAWSHDVVRFADEIDAFRAVRIELTEHGPVKAVIRVESEYGRSTIIQEFALYRGLAKVDVHVTVDWRERFRMLKLRFPVQVEAAGMTYDIPYGALLRPNDGSEQPGLAWIDQSGSVPGKPADLRYGVSVLNDGKYSFDADGHVMSMTVLRSPVFSANHAADKNLVPTGYERFMDQGLQRFVYSIYPHAGGWREAGTVLRAAELNRPPLPVIETYHNGPFAQTGSFAYVTEGGDQIAVTALKPAEDGSGDWIVRCRETHGRIGAARIALLNGLHEISASFGPWEIKTFRVPGDPGKPVVEVDFLERPLEG